MIARTRMIITALMACHLFLLPGVLTSQLRPPEQPDTSTQAASQSSSSQAPSVAATPATSQLPDDTTPYVEPAEQSPAAKAQVTVRTDSGQEDKPTEQVIQQVIQSSNDAQELGPPRPSMNVALGRDEVLIRGDEQEKNQDIYKARGHVVMRFRTYILHADQVTYDSTTGQVTANGHVVFDGGPHNDHLVGTHATYDVSRDTGIFYDVVGSSGVKVKNKDMFLTSSTPFFFTGKVVDKLGPDHYKVNHGYITSCQLPKPKWQFDSQTAYLEMGDEATMHHATLRIRGVPVFYFPWVRHPTEFGRQSGFLMPVFGVSNTRGTILGDAFYWAINRSNDATLGASLYSARGWAQHGIFRSIGYNYQFKAEYFGVIDEKGVPQGQPGAGQKQGGEELRANGSIFLPDGFRGVLSADYLSSFLFRLAFAQGFTLTSISSEVRNYGFLSKNWNGYSLGFQSGLYQSYQSTNPGDVIEIAHIPTLEFSSVERPLNLSNLMYAYDVATEGLTRNEPGFATAPVVGRIDAHPYISLPTFLHGWTFRPEVGVRETYYSQRLQSGGGGVGVGTAISDPINRNVLATAMEIRPPTLSRIFDRKLFGYVMKHTVEPKVTYRYQAGIDNFSQIIRFDQRDILADTNEVEYGVVNRLFAKKTKSTGECFRNSKSVLLSQEKDVVASKKTTDQKDTEEAEAGTCDDKQGPAREVITWELAQKYFFDPTFGGALVPGQRNVFDSTVDFSGIAFLTEPRHFSPIISRFRAQDGHTDLQWDLDYDPVLHQVNASTLLVGQRLGDWGKWYVAAGHTYMVEPAETVPISGQPSLGIAIYNQYRVQVQYGSIGQRGLSSAVAVAVDARISYIQTATVQANYNWDCCGVTFEYSRYAFAPTISQENSYRFSFSLANIGTFGTIRRLQRLY